MEIIYDRIHFITLTNQHDDVQLTYIDSFDELCDEVIIATNIPLENIKRGWVGDMTIHFMGFALANQERQNLSQCIRDVLLSKVTASQVANNVILWKYVF